MTTNLALVAGLTAHTLMSTKEPYKSFLGGYTR
jgi:hypothetical protein